MLILHGRQVWLVIALDDDADEEEVHTFSTIDIAKEWCDRDPDRMHIIFSSVVDYPELTRMVTQ